MNDKFKNYQFDWELLDTVIGGKSAIDATFVGKLPSKEHVENFIEGYGLDPRDPVVKAELYGNFQEALQFIRRYFFPEAALQGIELAIPSSIYSITDITELFLIGVTDDNKPSEEAYWADIILKLMHTILHIDRDLRASYFSTVQMQIFDRFYKYIHRDEEKMLYFATHPSSQHRIPLVDFQTKAKKPRDSVIIKLLHKTENVAEALFDRVGIRFVTHTKFDILRVVKFLTQHNIVIPHNIKPSRSFNAIVDLVQLREEHEKILKTAIAEDWEENRILAALSELAESLVLSEAVLRNPLSLKEYKSVQFTCRHMIKYVDPFWAGFAKVRSFAKNSGEGGELAQKILALDISQSAGENRFFYPYEVQIVDKESYQINSEGEASHQQYKKTQLKFAMGRLFKKLFEFKGITFSVNS